VADVQPIIHPPKTMRTVWNVCGVPTIATTGKRTAQATAHPIAYVV
jgi:hypothetical protein